MIEASRSPKKSVPRLSAGRNRQEGLIRGAPDSILLMNSTYPFERNILQINPLPQEKCIVAMARGIPTDKRDSLWRRA